MKKSISLILALVLCLGLLSACGNSKEMEKYAGVYTASYYEFWVPQDNFYYKKEMVLNSDGTGTYTGTATSDGLYIPTGTPVGIGTITWEVSDGYIVVKSVITSFVNNNDGKYFTLFPNEAGYETSTETETYELKGNVLMPVAQSGGNWEKIQ